MGLTHLLTTFCLLVLVSSEDLSFKACCPKGRILRVDFGERHDVFGRFTPDSIAAKCVRSRKSHSSSLDGSAIEASTGEEFVPMVLKKTGIMIPSCEMGLQMFAVRLRNKTGKFLASKLDNYFLSDAYKNPWKNPVLMHLRSLEGYVSMNSVVLSGVAQRAMFMLTTSLFAMMTGTIQMQMLFVRSLDFPKVDMLPKNPILDELILRHRVVGTKYDVVAMSLP